MASLILSADAINAIRQGSFRNTAAECQTARARAVFGGELLPVGGNEHQNDETAKQDGGQDTCGGSEEIAAYE